jgi:tetratricopeptide (TPR) repeat protein
VRSAARSSQKEIEVCAQCHSRRSSITDDYLPGKSFLNHYMPSLLDEGMYYADGQIQDEVYVYGSFMQSKMQHQGVTCSDCHEPHSLKLRKQGNGVCLQCHAASRFDSKKHHFHETDSKGALCAECHMPPKNYMVVDPRHDHSIRIPRPELTNTLGVPNACNQCHEDKNTTWAVSQIKQWYGKVPVGYQQFANSFDAGRLNKPGAGKKLVQQIENYETPDIARATAAGLLSRHLDSSTFNVLKKGLQDDSAMVRMASVTALEGVPQEMLVQLVFPLLDDPARIVRIEAARVLAPVPVGQLQGEALTIYSRAASEYVNSQRVNSDMPGAQLNLGNYYAAKNELDKAEEAYKTAIRLDDAFVPAYINLADFYRGQQKDAEAEKILLKVIEFSPANASANYALGLLYIRKQDHDNAVKMLQQAAELELSNAHYTYVYAVALHSMGKDTESIEILQKAQTRFPYDRDILNALVAFHRDAGNELMSQNYLKKIQSLNQ